MVAGVNVPEFIKADFELGLLLFFNLSRAPSGRWPIAISSPWPWSSRAHPASAAIYCVAML